MTSRTYGSAHVPVLAGSGTGNSRGGGILKVTVTDKVVVDGTLSSDGNAGASRGGCSGGSVYVIAPTLEGEGTSFVTERKVHQR